MIIKTLPVGPLETNCFIVGDEKSGDAIVIDPGGSAGEILDTLRENRLTCKKIVITHAHFDHVGGLADLKEKTGAEVLIHPTEVDHLPLQGRMSQLFGVRIKTPPSPTGTLSEGDSFRIGQHEVTVVHTPGHSPGSICLLIKDAKAAFVGDLLFQGSIGRTDFPGGSYESLIDNVVRKIFTLGDDWTVYPGHGPKTTVGIERKTNPFF